MDDRAEFEAWAKSKGAPKDGWWIRQIDDGGYSCHAVDMAWDAWQAATQRQQERIAALEAQVQALKLDSERYQFAIDSSIEYGRLNFKAIYDAWDGDGSFSDQIDAAIARATHKEQT